MSEIATQTQQAEIAHFPGKPETLADQWHRLVADNEPEKARKPAPEKTISPEEEAAAKKWEERREREWRERNETPDLKKSWESFRQSVSKHADDLAAEGKPKSDKEAPGTKSEPEVNLDPEVKREAKPSEAASDEHEPKPDDNMWVKKLEQKDIEVLRQRVQRADEGIKSHIEKHEQRTHIKAALGNMFTGRPDQQRNDFIVALTEVKNPGEILGHLGLNKADREALLQQPNWLSLRAAVHHLSQALGKVEAKPEPAPKPRAPKPPVEVGGRGTVSDHEGYAVRSNDFAAAEAIWNARSFRKSAR